MIFLKRQRRWTKFVVLLSALTILCGSCFQEKPKMETIDIFAMDTFMSVRAYTRDETVLTLVEGEILRLEGLFSVTKSGSDICNINTNGAAKVDPSTLELVSSALGLCGRTDGALDLSVYPLVALWGFTTGENRIPSTDEINNKLQYVDYRNVQIGENIVNILPGMQIDLGAVAKGYTGDRICRILSDHGVESAVVNLGGNVQTIGKRADGALWRVGIKNPFDVENNLMVIEVENKAVVTSGNYERFFIGDDGKRYCHIIDPKTGMPSDNGIVSMTIIGESGLLCDGLSTALFVMGEEKAIKFWQNSDDFEMIFVTSEGRIGITEGISETCSNLSELETTVITRE